MSLEKLLDRRLELANELDGMAVETCRLERDVLDIEHQIMKRRVEAAGKKPIVQ